MKRNCKSWLWKRMGFLMPSHPVTNFQIQKYYQNEPRFNAVFSRDHLPKTLKDGAYIINLDECADVGTHWIAFTTIVLVFNIFLKKLKNLSGITNIFRVQANNSVMCGYFYIGFIDFILAGKN